MPVRGNLADRMLSPTIAPMGPTEEYTIPDVNPVRRLGDLSLELPLRLQEEEFCGHFNGRRIIFAPMGRPPSGKPRKERIALTLDPELLAAIREMATKEKESVSGVAERLITAGMTCPHCDKSG